MKKKRMWIMALIMAFSLNGRAVSAGEYPFDPVEYVNPLMGTQSTFELSTGNTYPAIARPWGMNFWTPQTNAMGNGWTYMYTSNKIRGFKQTHQPSPWINDYGQFSIMPVVGAPEFDEDKRASWFSHKGETAKPYYYKVYLAEHDVVAEFTPTERAAMFRFTFPESEGAYVVVDAFDKGSYIKVIPEQNKIIGYTTRNSGGVPRNFRNYFVVVFDTPFTYDATFADGALFPGVREQTAGHTGAVIGFKTRKGEIVHARVASSFISPDQAELNLKELGGDSFDTVAAKGKEAWNGVLGRIKVEGGNLDQYRTFYTCLYRSLLFPRKLYETDERGNVMHYSPHNGEVLPGYMYTDTGFWDTFRCLFPFLNLMFPSVNKEIQEGLINTYKESGFFPEWASPGHRDCMVGNNSASVLVDAYMKGVRVDDLETLYEGLVHGTESVHPKARSTGRLGYDYYNRLGYVPYDVKINESAARTLEYAYDDWCIYTIAKALNRPDKEIDLFAGRAMNYRNLFDKETLLMRGRNEDGTFASPFSPLKWGDAFTEGNSWHYTWSVFHDPQGLIDLMGGKEAFTGMLDSVFSVPPLFDDSYYGQVIHEIREMTVMNMGNYAHGNQPVQHMIYLYNYAGAPWKAQYWLRQVMDRMYTPGPDGYCGDEDNGQTSAWYVFSALGFYPVCPGTDEYVLGAPLFRKATLTFENGKTFVIDALDNGPETPYIQFLSLNGEESTKNYLKHADLHQGGTLNIVMSHLPNRNRGTEAGDLPYSFSTHEKAKKQKEPVDEVNPYMGNISHLLVPTYPTVHLPNSFLRIYPERADYTADRLNGLPLIVTGHRGRSAFKLSPFQGNENETPFVLPLSYDNEEVKPYRYSVYLDEAAIAVDYAPSRQSAVYNLSFERNEPPRLIFSCRQGALTAKGNTVTGYETISPKTKVYLYAETDAIPLKAGIVLEKGGVDWSAASVEAASHAALALAYSAVTGKLNVRYGISFISEEQAKRNLEREIAGYDASTVAEAGRKAWNEALNKICVEGGTENERAVFYTSLYRCYERPVELSEDGRYYSAFDDQVHDDGGRPFYTDDWIWDTYRAAHPLRILIDQPAENDIIRSFLLMAEQMGTNWMPTFPGIAGDGRAMNSNHGVAMVIDAYKKGLRGFDLEKAYQACKKAIEEKTLIPWSDAPAGWLDDFYREHGYIPALRPDEPETVPNVSSWEKRQPVAVTLGTAYDQWCLSLIARELGKEEEADYYLRCSGNYRNLFHPETRFFHPKDKEGKFIDSVDYRFSGGLGGRHYYDENNGYVYRWDVQHDIPGLIALMGGNEAFAEALDGMFVEPLGMSKWQFYALFPDHTGNVGQFSMANEPSLHIPYLYNYAGQPWKTQKRIRTLLDQWFRNDLMGVPGDEDGGGMSAFVVFSQMGFYPVTPGSPLYTIGSPQFSSVKIDLGNGRYFEIKAGNASAVNKYIQSAKLNGKPLDSAWFAHEDIANGGLLELEMGAKANKEWGKE